MRIGVVLPLGALDAPAVVRFAERAEELGFDSVWVFDHFFASMPGRPRTGIHEAWTIVSAVAARTSRVEIGQVVLCTAFRPPALLAKMAATADEVSGGRLILGLGAGWHDEEFRAFGFSTERRVGRFEEAVQIIRPLVNGEAVTFSGRHYTVEDARLLPFTRPIPILIASFRPRMLRLTARYADAWNTAWFGLPDARLRERLDQFDAALQEEGRDPATVRRTVGVAIDEGGGDGTVRSEELPRAIEAHEALGVADDLILRHDTIDERTLERVAAAVLGARA